MLLRNEMDRYHLVVDPLDRRSRRRRVEARYDAGILEVTVPVKEEADTRQIPVAVKR